MIEKLPSYFSFDGKKLDEFMSEIGITSDSQRKVFSSLVKMGSSHIPYREVLENKEIISLRNFESELTSLVKKLKMRSLGIILTQRNKEGQRENSKIILVEDKSPFFYFYLLLDLIDNLYMEVQSPFLTVSTLKRRGIFLPSEIVMELPLDQIQDNFLISNENGKKIFLIKVENETMPIPSSRLRFFIDFCLSKIRYTLQRSNVKDWLYRFLSVNVRTMSTILQENNLSSLINFCSVINENKEDFLSNTKINAQDDFFKAYQIINQYYLNQEQDRKSKADQEQIFLSKIRTIEEKLAQEKGFIEATKVMQIVNEEAATADNSIEFSRKAFESLIEHGKDSKYEIPNLLEFDGKYIYKKAFYPLFKKEFEETRSYVESFLILLASNALEQSISTVFSSQTNIDKETFSDLRIRFPFVHFCLAHPQILSEYIIYYLREVQNIKSIDEARYQIGLYAPIKEPVTVPIIEIYDISLSKIFEKAYKRLSFLKKVWYYITGRRSFYKDKVVKLDSIRMEAKLLSLEERKGKLNSIVLEEDSSKNLYKSEEKKSVLQARLMAKRKQLSQKETDEAWKKFEDQVKNP